MMEMSPAGELASDSAGLTLGENGRGTCWIVPRTRDPDFFMATLVPGRNSSFIRSVW